MSVSMRGKYAVVLFFSVILFSFICRQGTTQSQTDTYYFRSDLHTVNGLYSYQFKTSQSSSEKYAAHQKAGNYSGQWGIGVRVRHSNGSITNVSGGSPVALVNRTAGSTYPVEGYQSNTWSCPETELTTTDALNLVVYQRCEGFSWGVGAVSFVSPQLGVNLLNASSWTVQYYTYWWSDGTTTKIRFYFGIFYYNSRIENITTFTTPYQYTFFGAYNEAGIRNGAINVTVYHSDDTLETFEVDGSHSISPTAIPISAEYDLGYNESRVVYFYLSQENFTIVKPTEPYYTYFIEMIDYVGVSWGYLESLLNINGTDTVIERWDVNMLNELPFTLSWGKAYKLKLVCNKGSYNYPPFIAGASQTTSLGITQDMFIDIPTDISGVSIEATRENGSWIRIIYVDNDNLTASVTLDFYILGTTELQYSTEETTIPFVSNWYGADPDYHYALQVTVDHDRRGSLVWWIVLPSDEVTTDNPFVALDTLFATNDSPIAPQYWIGCGITLLIFSVFSAKNVGVGTVLGVITAMILNYIGLLNMAWDWLTLTFALAVLVAISIHKNRVGFS